MFPIEIISHLARMLSLTVRLYANMAASDLITLIFFSMIPLALPIVGLGLHLFVALIQAYIFMLLTTIYLGEATRTRRACINRFPPEHRFHSAPASHSA